MPTMMCTLFLLKSQVHCQLVHQPCLTTDLSCIRQGRTRNWGRGETGGHISSSLLATWMTLKSSVSQKHSLDVRQDTDLHKDQVAQFVELLKLQMASLLAASSLNPWWESAYSRSMPLNAASANGIKALCIM